MNRISIASTLIALGLLSTSALAQLGAGLGASIGSSVGSLSGTIGSSVATTGSIDAQATDGQVSATTDAATAGGVTTNLKSATRKSRRDMPGNGSISAQGRSTAAARSTPRSTGGGY